MGIFNSFSEWRAAKYEKRIADMETQGICPECRGSGINYMAGTEFFYNDLYNCPGCNGSGTFSDWVEINQEQGS